MNMKILSRAALFIAPVAFARVQLHITAELYNSPLYGTHSVDTTIELNAHETREIYNRDGFKTVVALLDEFPETCVVEIRGYAQNTDGQFMPILSNPTLAVEYNKPASCREAELLGDVVVESYTVSVLAQKV